MADASRIWRKLSPKLGRLTTPAWKDSKIRTCQKYLDKIVSSCSFLFHEFEMRTAANCFLVAKYVGRKFNKFYESFHSSLHEIKLTFHLLLEGQKGVAQYIQTKYSICSFSAVLVQILIQFHHSIDKNVERTTSKTVNKDDKV